MDPIMRKWLQSLSGQPLKTELDWQNRANKPLNETVYGIMSRVLLHEDIKGDMEAFQKRYREIHGIETDPDSALKAFKHFQQGGKLEDLFGSNENAKQEQVNPSKPKIKSVQPFDLSKDAGWQDMPSGSLFDPRKLGDYPNNSGEPSDIKSRRTWNETLDTAKKMGFELPPSEQYESLYKVHTSGKEGELLQAIKDYNEQMGRSTREGLGMGETKIPNQSGGGSQQPPQKPNQSGGGSQQPPQKPNQSGGGSPKSGPEKPKGSIGGSALDIGFGALGAADLPGSMERVSQGASDAINTGVYGYTRLGSGYKFNPVKNDYEKMTPTELNVKSGALAAQDTGQLVGNAAMMATTLRTPSAIADTTTAAKAAKAFPKVAQVISNVSKLPGAKQVAKYAPNIGGIASRVFPGAVAFSKAGKMTGEIADQKYADATKTGLEGAYWAAEMLKPGNKASSAGIGHELLGSGVKGLYSKSKEGNLGLNLDTGLDVLNTTLGAALTQAPYIAAAKTAGKEALEIGAKEAGEVAAKTAGKAALKAVGKQIPGVGLAVSLPFAALRAAQGDWSGAGLELAGAIPVVGLGAQGYLAVRDYEKEMEKLSNKGAQEAQAQDIRDELKFKSQNKKTQQPVNSETSSDFETIKQKYKKVNPGAVSDIDKDKTTEIEDLLKRDSEGQVTGWGGASEEELMGPDFLKQKGKKQSIFESVMRKGLEIKGL